MKKMRRLFAWVISLALVFSCFTSVTTAYALDFTDSFQSSDIFSDFYLESVSDAENSTDVELDLQPTDVTDVDFNLWLTDEDPSDTGSDFVIEDDEKNDNYEEEEDVPEVTKMKVYVNDKKISADVYQDEDGDIWVSSYNDLKKIFPKETKNLFLPTVQEATQLDYWASEFGYTMTFKSNKVYFDKEESKKEEARLPELVEESKPQFPTLVPEKEQVSQSDAKVYVNGMKIANANVYMDKSGTIRLKNVDAVYNIFQNNAPRLSSQFNYSTSLYDWAMYYRYNYAQRGVRAYLNNNNISPVELHLGWDIVDFPDQQPYVANGRTLIPVRAISETLGWKVDWNGTKVTISNGNHTVVLIINSKSYTIDGKEKVLDVPAQVYNGRTMVPIRFIAESFGYNVNYDDSGAVKVVTLSK